MADEYVHSLSTGSISEEQRLESPKLQKNVVHCRFLSTFRITSPETFKRIDSYAGSDDQGDYVAYVYKDDTYFLKIALSKYYGEWQVWFFDTSYAVLRAASN